MHHQQPLPPTMEPPYTSTCNHNQLHHHRTKLIPPPHLAYPPDHMKKARFRFELENLIVQLLGYPLSATDHPNFSYLHPQPKKNKKRILGLLASPIFCKKNIFFIYVPP